MRRYEMMLIVSDTLEEDDALAVLDKAKEVLTENGGEVIDENWWGKRKFAYEIEKRNYGFYAVLDINAEHATIVEVERQLKLRDEVVRFKTIRPELRVTTPSS